MVLKFQNRQNQNRTVVVEGNASSRTAILNRPSSLNALNIPMIARLHKLYKNWEHNPDIEFVVLKGKGRAFCAGGDIVAIYNLMKEGKVEECEQFFSMAYSLIHTIGTYSKPHLAILHGISMGGGAGISIPGSFRVATDKTIFATPETLIGFHPDGGASFYLSRLPGYLGEYLAMTGDKLNGAEMLSCGLATHYSLTTKLPLFEKKLGDLVIDGDPCAIDNCLACFNHPVHFDQTSVINRIETVNKCFSRETVEEIIDSLAMKFPQENEAARTNDAWCVSTLKKLNEVAPLSLKVALRSIREGRLQSLEQCLVREYGMTVQAISRQITGDFFEGVRAKLVDKDFAPKWDPPSLEHVSQDMVDQYFSPISQFEPHLKLHTQRSQNNLQRFQQKNTMR
ncbi:hypothetical protein CASFOL_041209 [Castilleja foliolosa]|uniref:3-hydroxyisobutyryl-CoA hydrolase n=1 Tax=Castilleja foliolosa TaxID=1961234 RepID=A0ABD3BDS1_9LAMI